MYHVASRCVSCTSSRGPTLLARSYSVGPVTHGVRLVGPKDVGGSGKTSNLPRGVREYELCH